MAFKPSDDFMTLWTNRTVADLRRNAVLYALGNNSGEGDLAKFGEYKVAKPQYSTGEYARDRDASTGALSDFAKEYQEPSVDFITVKPDMNRNFSQALDQRDAGRVTSINLAGMRKDMLRSMRLWVDDNVAAKTIANIKSANTTAGVVTGGVTVSRGSGKLAGGSAANQQATRASFVDWIDDLEIKLATLNASSGISDGDAYELVVVMPPSFFRLIREWLLAKYASIDLIVMDNLRSSKAVLGGPAYRGSLFNRPIVTTGSTKLTAQANNQLNRAFAVAVGANSSYDTALVSYGGLKYNSPDATSAKHRLRMEVELAYQIIEPDSLYQFTLPASN